MTARGLVVLEVSDPSDAGQVALVGGERLAGLTTSSQLGVGFHEATWTLLADDLSVWWPIGRAEEIDARWWLCVVRILAAGESVWVGRIEDITLSNYQTDPALGLVCQVSLRAVGLAWSELTNELPELPGEMVDEDATVSLSDLVRELVTEAGGLIAATFGRVRETAINLGPIAPSDQDLPLDLITAALRAGDDADEESTFLVFEPEDGPIVQPLCGDGEHLAVRWTLDAAGTGISLRRVGAERANALQVVYTDDVGSSQSYGPIDDPVALARQGGIRRLRTVALDRIGEDGVAAAARAALALKADPRAIDGSVRLRPVLEDSMARVANAERALEPAWRVRAGDLARFADLAPHDPIINDARAGYLVVVRQSAVDWDSGEVTLAFDRRRIASRPGEDQAAIVVQRRAMAPGSAKTTLLQATSGDAAAITVSGTTGDLLTFLGDEGELAFRVSRTQDVEIVVAAEWTSTDNTTSDLYMGVAWDGEAWVYTDREQSVSLVWSSTVNAHPTYVIRLRRRLARGEHTVRVYCAEDASAFTYTVQYASVRIVG